MKHATKVVFVMAVIVSSGATQAAEQAAPKPLSQLTMNLALAIDRGDKDEVASLIQQKADVTRVGVLGSVLGYTLGRWARHHENHPAIVELLLKNKADPNPPDDWGNSVMIQAVRLQVGPSIGDDRESWQPYDAAPIVELLLQHKASVNYQTRNGLTALHFAAKCKEPLPLLRLLIENKADPELLEKKGA